MSSPARDDGRIARRDSESSRDSNPRYDQPAREVASKSFRPRLPMTSSSDAQGVPPKPRGKRPNQNRTRAAAGLLASWEGRYALLDDRLHWAGAPRPAALAGRAGFHPADMRPEAIRCRPSRPSEGRTKGSRSFEILTKVVGRYS